jgi:hypothetical protein
MWKYINVKVPAETALCVYNGDELKILEALLGPGNRAAASTTTGGSSPFGSYEEANFRFVEDGDFYTLDYDFIIIGDCTARIFRYCVTEN